MEKPGCVVIKKYHKLIRDRIPGIIKKSGEIPHCRVLDQREFFEALKKKILEEAKELIAAKDRKEIINEIVDILEIVDALITEIGVSKLEICTLRRRKNQKRGAFKKRLFLVITKFKPRA